MGGQLGSIVHADEVTLSPNGPKSRTPAQRRSSAGTKARARIGRMRDTELEKTLDARTRELEEGTCIFCGWSLRLR